MAKLKNLIKQLSQNDYQNIYDGLVNSGAGKSADLLKFLRERSITDAQIMAELDVNTNAYYTLRSRLNQRIEEYLLQQIENPRTDLLKKVANISEVVFTKKRAIAVATLKKLEKELIDYDLANELTIVYKNLKKLHLNSPDSYTYSQLYNRHVAYMLALDKAEDLLAEYMRKYGNYFLSGSEIEKLELTLLYNEMVNVCKLYQSHRLYIYMQCMGIFHRIFVSKEEGAEDEPIEDILATIEKTFDTYYLDAIYHNLQLLTEFLTMAYYSNYRLYRKADKFYDEVNGNLTQFLSNYSLYTFPAAFLVLKLERSLRGETERGLYEENRELLEDYEADVNDLPKYIIYISYLSLSAFYAGKYRDASRLLQDLLNEVSLKRFPLAHIEIKLLLTLQHCVEKNHDLFNHNVNSIQRQIRLLGEDVELEHASLFIKMMKVSLAEGKAGKKAKIKTYFDRLKSCEVSYFSPIKLLRYDDAFAELLS